MILKFNIADPGIPYYSIDVAAGSLVSCSGPFKSGDYVDLRRYVSIAGNRDVIVIDDETCRQSLVTWVVYHEILVAPR